MRLLRGLHPTAALLACALALPGCQVVERLRHEEPKYPLSPATGPDSRAIAEFNEGVVRYMGIRERAVAHIDKEVQPGTSTEMNAREKQLATALLRYKKEIRQGRIFDQTTMPLFKRLLREETRGPGSADTREDVLKDGNPRGEGPTAPVKIAPGVPYNDAAPLSTVPPNVLEKLPQLPKELDYRFVGPHLILRDVDANIIVDYMMNAVE